MQLFTGTPFFMRATNYAPVDTQEPTLESTVRDRLSQEHPSLQFAEETSDFFNAEFRVFTEEKEAQAIDVLKKLQKKHVHLVMRAMIWQLAAERNIDLFETSEAKSRFSFGVAKSSLMLVSPFIIRPEHFTTEQILLKRIFFPENIHADTSRFRPWGEGVGCCCGIFLFFFSRFLSLLFCLVSAISCVSRKIDDCFDQIQRWTAGTNPNEAKVNALKRAGAAIEKTLCDEKVLTPEEFVQLKASQFANTFMTARQRDKDVSSAGGQTSRYSAACIAALEIICAPARPSKGRSRFFSLVFPG